VQDPVCCIFVLLSLDVAIAPGMSGAFIVYLTTFRGTCAWTGPFIVCFSTFCKRPGDLLHICVLDSGRCNCADSIFVPTVVQDRVCCIFVLLTLDVAIAPGRSGAFILYFITFRGTCAWTGPCILCFTTFCKRPGDFHFHINLFLRLWSKDTSISSYDNGQKTLRVPLSEQFRFL